MSKAEERAFEYQMSIGPNVIGGAGLLSEDEFKKLNINHHFKAGYEQAEKELIPLINRLCEAILFEWKDAADLARETLTQIKEREE